MKTKFILIDTCNRETDIRTFYMTDLRCSKTFDRKEDNND